jgi:hypothetical protein
MSTHTLIFSNPGELDLRLVQLMGATVKEARSPIGRFGTGLKYAIAGTLRLGGTMTIWSGHTKAEFFSVPEVIRGKEFRTVNMTYNGIRERLSFTLDLGSHWEPWMIYRELWSNAKDEGGHVSATPSAPLQGAAGHTHIIVRCPELLRIHLSSEEYILPFDPKDTLTPDLEIRNKPSQYGYYQNIRVCELPEPADYTYNVLGKLTLTEDRTCDPWVFNHAVVSALMQSNDETLLREIIKPTKDTFEHSLRWDLSWRIPSKAMTNAAAKVRRESPALLSDRLWTRVKDLLPPEVPPFLVPSKLEYATISRATLFLSSRGFTVASPVRVLETIGHQWVKAMVGSKAKDEIWLTRDTLAKGTKFVAATLLEEHLHITHGLRDQSRELQDWLLTKVIDLMEELGGEPI